MKVLLCYLRKERFFNFPAERLQQTLTERPKTKTIHMDGRLALPLSAIFSPLLLVAHDKRCLQANLTHQRLPHPVAGEDPSAARRRAQKGVARTMTDGSNPPCPVPSCLPLLALPRKAASAPNASTPTIPPASLLIVASLSPPRSALCHGQRLDGWGPGVVVVVGLGLRVRGVDDDSRF
mgnify:CR=1 FL=1